MSKLDDIPVTRLIFDREQIQHIIYYAELAVKYGHTKSFDGNIDYYEHIALNHHFIDVIDEELTKRGYPIPEDKGKENVV